MSLMIERLVTRCQAPRRLKLDGALVDRVAHEQFPSECARRLQPRWPGHGGVCRIRRLPVRLTVSLADLNDTRLPQLWAAAFARAMTEALARPAGSGPVEVVRAENRVEWLAKFIHDLLNGNASGRWEYQEFQEYFELSIRDAVLAVLNQQPSEIVSVLVALEARGALDRLLALFDEIALEQLFVASARAMGVDRTGLSITDMLTVGRLALAQCGPRSGLALRSRQFALKLFLILRRESGLQASDTWSPRRVLYALMSLAALAQLIRSAEVSEWSHELSAASLAEYIKEPLHPVVLEVLEEVRNLVQTKRRSSRAKAGVSSTLTELTHLIAELRPLVSITGNHNNDIRWMSSDCAGLFLLIGVLNKLGWPERILRSSLGSAHGPRAVTYVFAGLGLALLGRFDDAPERIDPGLALFAGWVGDPDLGGLRRFFASGSAADRLAVLTELDEGTEGTAEATESWSTTFDYLAERVVCEFTRRVRGFRQASRSFVVKSFFAIPGRIGVKEKRMVVQLAPSPFHVALHISSMDESVESVSWLDGRRLAFHLEGMN